MTRRNSTFSTRVILTLILPCLILWGCGSESSNEVVETPVNQDAQIAAITKNIEANPDRAELYYSRGITHMELKQVGPAIMDFQEAIGRDSFEMRYYVALSEAFLERGDGEGAAIALQAGLNYEKNDPELLQRLGELEMAREQFASADACFDRIIEGDPTAGEPWLWKGLVQLEQDKPDLAEKHFLKATRVQPDGLDAWIKLSDIAVDARDRKGFIYLNNAIRLDPKDYKLVNKKGYLHLQLGEYTKALSAFKTVVRNDPQFEMVYRNLGYTYLELDSLDQSYKYYDLAVSFDPSNSLNYFGRGVAAQALGNNNQAILDFENTLALDRNNEEAYNRLSSLKNAQ